MTQIFLLRTCGELQQQLYGNETFFWQSVKFLWQGISFCTLIFSQNVFWPGFLQSLRGLRMTSQFTNLFIPFFFWLSFLPEPLDLFLSTEHSSFSRQKSSSFFLCPVFCFPLQISVDFFLSLFRYLLCLVKAPGQHCHIFPYHLMYQYPLNTNSLVGIFIGQNNVSNPGNL